MRCRLVHRLLPAFLDGDLSGRLNQWVSDHLDRCQQCRSELDAQQRALRVLDAGRRPVSIDLWADFSRRLQQKAPPRPSPWWYLWQPGLAAALAAIVVALVAHPAPELSVPPITSSSPATKVASLPSAERMGVAAASAIQPLAPIGTPRVMAGARLHPNRVLRRSRLAAVPSRSESVHSNVHAWRQEVAAPPVRLPSSQRTAPHSDAQPAGVPAKKVLAARQNEAADRETLMASSSSHDALHLSPIPIAMPASDPAHLASPRDEHGPDTPRRTSGDPLEVAEALVAVQQTAASDQMQGELLVLAREVARVGGEAGDAPASKDASGG